MNLLLLAAIGLSTISQTVLASPAPAAKPGGREIYAKTSTAIEKNPDKALCVDVTYTPDYSFEGRANLTFARENPPKAPYTSLQMIFLCPDCPITFVTPSTGIDDRVFTPFTLQEVSFPASKKSDKRKISFRVEFIPPAKGKVSADYQITFYQNGKPAFKHIYQKKISPSIPINYIVLQNEKGGDKWCDVKYELITLPKREIEDGEGDED